MSKVEELVRVIEHLPTEDFEKLSAWMAGRHAAAGQQRAGAPLALGDHAAFLNSYVPQDEGLYDDAKGR